MSVCVYSQESEDKSLFKSAINNLKQNEENLRPKISGKKLATLAYPWVGYVSDVEGKAIIQRYDNDGLSILATFEAKEGDLVHEKDFFDIRAKSSIEITLKNDTEIALAPNTFFKVQQHYLDAKEQNSIFNLLSGRARINIKHEKKISKVKIYSPNLVIESDQADIVLGYNSKSKTSMVACFDGSFSAVGSTDIKGKKKYNQFLYEDEYMEINTSYDEQGESYLNTDPAKMSTSYRRDVLESLNADYRELDPWAFTRISTSFLRFAPSFDYSTVKGSTSTYYNFSFGYIPLIHLMSIFYIEPYFFASLAAKSQYFLRTGASLDLYLFRGFYVGGGGGVFWVSDSKGSGADLSANLGYTFSGKQMGLFDGIRFAYYRSKTPIYDVNSFLVSLVLNFSGGRDDD
ncbi:MAG: FecR domain-containing protein [bacterium]